MREQRQNKDESAVIAKHGKRGITRKLTTAIVITITVMVAALLLIVYNRVSDALLEKSEKLLTETTDKALQETSAWINKTVTMLDMQKDTIEYEDMDIARMKDYIKHTVDQNAAYPAGLYVALADGSLYHASFVPGPDFNALEKSWYINGIASENFILGDVYFDEDSQSYVVGASGALKDADGNIRGVAAADVYLNSISDIVQDIRLEKTGGIFLVDTRTDTIIGHQDKDITGKNLSEFKGDMYAYAAEQIHSGAAGLSVYNDDMYIQVAEVPNSDWTAVAYVSKAEVLGDLKALTGIMASVSLFAVIITVFLIIILVRRIIGKPVAELNDVAAKIAEGELNQTIRHCSNDELGELADNFGRTVIRLRDYVDYIDEISEKLQDIAQGNLAFTLSHDYVGEFAKIRESLEKISLSLNGTLGQINRAAGEVAEGSGYVSDGAQTLSQGSSQQTNAVELLATHISEVSDGIQKTATGAKKANEIAQQAGSKLLESNDKMYQMNTAIQKISGKSSEIHNIIKTIEDIAFQTNLLALNASVEAARAGAAGKGFAVVADEVKQLAAKSAGAAQNATEIVSNTRAIIQTGVELTADTAGSLRAISDVSTQISAISDQLVSAVQGQKSALSVMEERIASISSIAERNLQNAGETEQSSAMLTKEAEALQSQVQKFVLKEEGDR